MIYANVFHICWCVIVFVEICWYMLVFIRNSLLYMLTFLIFVGIRLEFLMFVCTCSYFCRFVGIDCLWIYTIVCYRGCKSPKSIPRSIPKVYPEVYQKCCRSAIYAFVRFLFVIMCSYFFLFVWSRCLLMTLGSVVIVWYLLLLVGIRKYS